MRSLQLNLNLTSRSLSLLTVIVVIVAIVAIVAINHSSHQLQRSLVHFLDMRIKSKSNQTKPTKSTQTKFSSPVLLPLSSLRVQVHMVAELELLVSFVIIPPHNPANTPSIPFKLSHCSALSRLAMGWGSKLKRETATN